MSTLERLQKEAQEARDRRASEAGVRARQETMADSQLGPVLEQAANYLEKAAANLRDLDRSIERSFTIEHAGVLDGLRQEGYRVVRSDEASGSVQLRFVCTGPKPLEVSIDGHPRAETLVRKLRDAGLTCHLRPISDRAMRLRVDAKIPVRVSLVPDAERVSVMLELRNLTAVGVQRYPFTPERIDAKLLDSVISLVLREPSNFAAITGSVVDDGQRALLRRRLAREDRQREAEVAGGLRRLVFPMTEWFRRRVLGG